MLILCKWIHSGQTQIVMIVLRESNDELRFRKSTRTQHAKHNFFFKFTKSRTEGCSIYWGLAGQESPPCFNDLQNQHVWRYMQLGLHATLLLNEKQKGGEDVDEVGALLVGFGSDCGCWNIMGTFVLPVFVMDDGGILFEVFCPLCGQSWYKWEVAPHEKHSNLPLECGASAWRRCCEYISSGM